MALPSLPKFNAAGFTHKEWDILKLKIPSKCGYNKKFKHNTNLNCVAGKGPRPLTIEWAAKNCKDLWGWWFDNDKNAHMSFRDKTDMAHWLLVNYNKQNR